MPFLKGIAEDYISTRWFVTRFEELAGVKINDVKDLVENYRDSPYFRSIFTEFSINLAKFIYKFVRKKMPLAAVIGGNIVQAEAYFLDDTRKYLAQMMGYSFPIKRSTLGETAALIGAGSSL
jgi:glucokinase